MATESDEDPFANVEWEEDEAFDASDRDESDNENEANLASKDTTTLTFERTKKEDGPPKKKQRIKSVKFSEEDYEVCLQRSQKDLSLRISYIMNVMRWSEADELIPVVQGIPDALLHQALTDTAQGHSMTNVLHLRNAVRQQFKVIPNKDLTEDEGRDGSTTEELIHQVIKHKHGSAIQLQQILYALLRSYRIRCRWITALQSTSLHPQDHSDLLYKNADSPEQANALFAKGKGQEHAERARVWCLGVWIEVWVPGIEGFWLDVVHGVYQGPQAKQQARIKSFPFVLCFENKTISKDCHKFIGRDITDIFTAKYCCSNGGDAVSSSSSAALTVKKLNKRIQESDMRRRSWLQAYLSQLSTKQAKSSSSSTKLSQNTTTSNTTSSSSGPSSRTTQAPPLVALNSSVVIDLLDEDEDEAESQPVQQQTVEIVDLDGEDDDDMDAQERLLEHFAVQRQQQLQRETLPTTIAGFAAHPLFCLARHLHADQMIHPLHQSKAVVALFRGEPVHMRTHIETLKTRDQWRRLLRQVKAEEKERPARTTQRKVLTNRQYRNNTSSSTAAGDVADAFYPGMFNAPSKSSSGGSSTDNGVEIRESKLYGIWQTEVYQVPPVSADGWIPRNDYGNLEIWDGLPQFVPAGAAYLPGTFVARAAQSLGLQYVPAVVGFERRAQTGGVGGGQVTIPKINGIVVLADDVALVQDAAFQMQQAIEEKEAQQRYQVIVQRWARLVQVALARETLRQRYGH